MGSTDIIFESLHSEIIGRVCQYLDETHPPSLLAFARVSKNCYANANSRLFRTVKLTTSDGRELVQAVQKWETLLSREDGFRHVRRLIIYWTDNQDERHDKYLSLDPSERHDNDSGLQTCWDLYNYRFPAFSESSIQSEDWAAVARLVKRLTGLTDIFYACPGQFPASVLQILHTHLPRCRLHDYTFHLRTLDRGPTSVDPLEMALANSPCVHSIGELNLGSDRVVWDFVRHQASRLKQAHIWLPGDEAIDLDEEGGKWHWTGVERRPPIPLEVFHLNRPTFRERPLSFSTISWAVDGDFSALRVLKLDSAVTSLDSLPAPTDFPALVTLAFRCATSPHVGYWNTLLTFVHDLPRLTTLLLRDWNRSISIVPGLSPNLRKLDFATRVDVAADHLKDDHIRHLADLCPDLEDLAVEIRRSRRRADEVPLYRALGRLHRLQYLTINLDASPPGLDHRVEFLDAHGHSISYGTTIEPWFDAEDVKTLDGPLRPYRQGHIHDMLVNSAVDSGLARSIFEVVSKAKLGLSGGTLPLERLQVRASLSENFPPTGTIRLARSALLPFVAALDRRWLVERSVRDDARNMLHVMEVDREARLSHSSALVQNIPSSSKYLLDIWRRVWPSTEDESIWWDNWKSQPLAVEA